MPTVVVCPSCGYHFERPFWSERTARYGYTIAALGYGVLTCPRCGYVTDTRAFKKATGPPPPLGGASPRGDVSSTEAAFRPERGDTIDDLRCA